MAQGGARVNSGPAPNPNALRPNALRRDIDKNEWTHLPKAGRTEPAPAWPLTAASRREKILWDLEWKRPQALRWEATGQVLEVAIYVRTLAGAERPRSPSNLRSLLRQQMDSLGITLGGMRLNRWIIDEAEAPAQDDAPPETVSGSARDRFKIINIDTERTG